MYAERRALYEKLEKERKSKVLAIITGDRPNLETQLAPVMVDLVGDLLDHYEGSKRISIFLYTRGGDVITGWSLVNLFREFCKELEFIIPAKCHSSGTLMCLGANALVMTKQATISPIDPSINSPLNPPIPNLPPERRLPVSVEDVAGFIDMAREEAGLRRGEELTPIFMKLAEAINPIVLGRVSRARGQIKELARKLLQIHMKDARQIKKIVQLLCVEAGSHDYTIHRTEARRLLKLNIETPSMDLYKLIKDLYLDIRNDLALDEPFNIGYMTAGMAEGNTKDYTLSRAIIETPSNGGYRYVTKGSLKCLGTNPAGQLQAQNNLIFDGWERVNVDS